MNLRFEYEGKKDLIEFYNQIPSIKAKKNKEKGLVFKGENTIVLKSLIENYKLEGKIDLIYIDPPFATNNVFTISDGRSNTISNSKNGQVAYTDTLKEEQFLEFIRERAFLLHKLLSDKGSFYLHIDYKIGHYVKIILDEVFGEENFRNDISRIKCNPKNFKRKGYGNIKDMVLFYSKTKNVIWNEPKAPYTESDLMKLFPKVDSAGRKYTTIPLHAPGETMKGSSGQMFKGQLPPKGRHWRSDVKVLEEWDNKGLIEWSSNGNPRKKIYSDEQEGKRIQDIWEFKDPQYPKYPTEKNFEMLDLIVKTSSNEESIVLDCFAGSGTTLIAALRNNRKFIGIDQSEESIKVITERLNNEVKSNLFFSSEDYSITTI